MSKSQIEFTKKKRLRSHSLKYPENAIRKEFVINKENSKYYFHIYLEENQKRILIKSGIGKDILKYELGLDLASLQQKSRIFNICYTLEEAFKIITNLFKNKKVEIQEGAKDSLGLIFYILNIFDDREYEIELNLIKNKNLRNNLEEQKENSNKNLSQKENKVDNGSGNKENNEFFDIEQKIDMLFKINQDKDNQLIRIEKNFDEIKTFHINLKKETNNIRKTIGLPIIDYSDKSQSQVNENSEGKETNENLDNQIGEGKIEDNIYKEEQKEEVEQEKEKEKKDKRRGKSNQKSFNKKLIKLKEIKGSKDILAKDQINSKNAPKMVYVKDLTKKAICKYLGDNTFALFKSINNEWLLVYGTAYMSLHFYDIELEKVTKRISNAHEYETTNFRHSFDKSKNRDLLITICNYVKNVKVWDVQKLNCIINISSIYNFGDLFSSCFLMDDIHSKNYIICINSDKENLKIFDFSGKKVTEINNANDKSYLVDSFYNSKSKKYFIIVLNEKNIVSYNFPDKTIFHKYYESKTSGWHIHFIIKIINKEINLIESDSLGYVRIWDFNKGELLKKIFVEKKKKIRAVCLWSSRYLFVSSEDKKIKLIDLEIEDEIDNLKVNDTIIALKKIESKKLGECLIILGKSDNTKIRMWKNENSK